MQYEHIQDGLFRESHKTSVADTRRQWNWAGMFYMDLVEWDLVRPEHQVRFFNSPAIQEAPSMFARGLDKCGRMVIIVKSESTGVMVAVQNGQYLTSIYTNAEVAKLFRAPGTLNNLK